MARHRARVAEREVDVLAAVDVAHARAPGLVEIERERPGRLVHPGHRHAAEQVGAAGGVGAGGARVQLREPGALAVEQRREPVAVDRVRDHRR
jgi:hypothetical protein